MYDFLIIGGGPAAIAAGVYSARKKLKTILITEEWGGQSVVSAGIRNWIGIKNISGLDFAKSLEGHIRAHEDVEIIIPDKVINVEKANDHFKISTEKGNVYEAKTIFIGSGARRKKIGMPGEKEFDGRGVAYCSTCDAPIFKDKDTAVIGGGNAGLEAVMDLLPYARSIKLLEYGDALKGDPVTQEKVKASDKVEIILNAQTLEIFGGKFVEGLKYKNRTTGEEKMLELKGVFVEIGSVPNSDMVKDIVSTNKFGEIIVDHKNSRTSLIGIWAGGDVTDDPFKQNNISAGDGVKAALDAYSYLTLGNN